MINTKMYVPKTIHAGYQKRDSTYTGKLAYIIYTDDKGKLRKETSWQSWRDSKLGKDDFDNIPTSGFVLNKKAGGVGSGWGWNDRLEKVRVYDPRDFEFEISIPNLLFILQECTSIKGKGLEGDFVYAWNGTELVLLPTCSSEYKECIKHTQRQSVKFKKEDIKEGFSYMMKDGTEVMYLGRLPYNDTSPYYNSFKPVGLKHMYIDLNYEDSKYRSPYIAESGHTKIAECTSPKALDSFPEEYDKFKNSIYYGAINDIIFEKDDINSAESMHGKSTLIKENNKFYSINLSVIRSFKRGPDKYILTKSDKEVVAEIKNNSIKIPEAPNIYIPYYYDRYADHSGMYNTALTLEELIKKYEFYFVYVVTEHGKKIRI